MYICKTFSCLQKIAFVEAKIFTYTQYFAVLIAPSLHSYCVLYLQLTIHPDAIFFTFFHTQENSSALTCTLPVRWPAGYGRPEFKSRLGTPGMFFPLSKQATKTKERGLGEW